MLWLEEILEISGSTEGETPCSVLKMLIGSSPISESCPG